MQHRTSSSHSLQNSRHKATLLIVLALFIGFFILRFPFRSKFLVNWDAVNFALGTYTFDVEHHQPHPPGYIGYVALGRFLNYVTGDANASLTFLSILSGAAAPAILFVLGLRFMRRRYAMVTAILFGLSPVVWYYSEVALTYSVEMVLTLLFLWIASCAHSRHSERALLSATVLLAGLGAVRQSTLAFLLPLWLYMMWRFPWSIRIRAVTILGVGNLAWFIPLIWLTGGPIVYIREMVDLIDYVVVRTSLASYNPWGPAQNFAFIGLGLLVGINFGLIIISFAFQRGVSLLTNLSAEDQKFLLLWITPPLLTYLLVHTGQVGYILLILPAVFLCIGILLSNLAQKASPTTRYLSRAPFKESAFLRRSMVTWLIVAFALSNVVIYFAIPEVAHALARSDDGEVREVVNKLRENLPGFENVNLEGRRGVLEAGARQYDIKYNDAHWQQLTDLIQQYDSDTTVVLAVPNSAGSFRHLMYYLPDYRVYAVGEDLHGAFGYLSLAYRRSSFYSVEGLRKARSTLYLPQTVRRLIIPDRAIYKRLDADIPHHTVTLDSGYKIIIVPVSREATLTFTDADGFIIRSGHYGNRER